MKRIPSCVWVLVGYCIALALISESVLSGRLNDAFFFLFSIPAILSAYFFKRRLYLTLHLLVAIVAFLVISQVSKDPQLSRTTIVISTLSSLILAEILRALVVARQKTANALKASETRLAQVIQSSPIPIFVLDAQHRVTHWNRAVERLTGVSAEEIIGTQDAWRPFYQEKRPVMADLVLKQADEADIRRHYQDNYQLSDLVPGAYTGEVHFPDFVNQGREAWVRFSAAPLKNTAGESIGAIETLQDITQHRQTEAQIHRRNAQLEALRAISLDLTTELELDALLQSIVKHAVDLLDSNHGGLYLYQPERNVLERVISTGPNAIPLGFTLQRGEGLSGLIWEQGRTLCIDDYQQWEGASVVLEGEGAISVVGAPVQWGEEFLGVINVANHDTDLQPFTETDAELLSLFAGQAAIALRNARLYEEAQQRALEQKTLREAALALTKALEPDEVIERILAQLQEVVPYDTASVQLLQHNHLEIVGGRGFPNLEELLGFTFDITEDDNPNREVIRRKGPFIVDNAPEHYENFKREPHAQANIHSWLGVPLLTDEMLVGMIALDKQEPDFYTEDHAQLAEAFAAQAATAVENAQLLDAAQQRSARLRKTLALSELLHQGLALEEVLQRIAQGAASLGFKRAVLNLYDPEHDVIKPRTVVGLSTSDREALEESAFHWEDVQALLQDRFKISHSYLVRQDHVDWAEALPGGRVIDSELKDRGEDYWRPQDSLLIPLWDSRGTPIGLLSVDEPEDGMLPELDTVRTLETFANQAAIAVENAQLVEDLEAKVETRTAEIAAERDNSNAILQSVGHPIALINLKNRIQYINEAFSALSGYRQEELLDKPIHRLIEGKALQDYLPAALMLAETQGRHWQGELVIRRKDERTREVIANIVALHDADGASTGYITSYQDVSRLNALDRARREFITNVSHQLRTPVTTIGLLLDLLPQKDMTAQTVQDYVEMMQTEINSLKHLVEDILTIARLDSGEALSSWRPISLPDILDNLYTRYQEYAASAEVTFSVEPPSAALPKVYGDTQQIIHLLSEIIENAVNFTPPGGRVRITSDVVERNGHDWARIAIRDTGPGITTEEMEKIFDRFFRGRLAASGTMPGTGLGLSIAQALARAHGGQVTVKSTEGAGTTFTLWLPHNDQNKTDQNALSST